MGYEILLASLGMAPDHVVHLWGLTGGTVDEDLTAVLERGFASVLRLADAAASLGEARPCEVWVVLDPIHDVHGDEILRPIKATVLGACEAIARFWPGLAWHVLDTEARDGGADRLVERLLAEAGAPDPAPVTADRGGRRWLPGLEEIGATAGAAPIVEGGAWLLPGGLIGLGFAAAKHLAREARASLILLEEGAPEELEGEALVRLRELESFGVPVLVVQADLGDPGAIEAGLFRGIERFGDLTGVVCTAEPVRAWDENTGLDELVREVVRKVRGVLRLEELLRGQPAVRRFLLSAAREGSAAERSLSHFFDSLAAGAGEGARWMRLSFDRLRGNLEVEVPRLLPRLFALDVPWVVVEPPAHAREAAGAVVGAEASVTAHSDYVAPRNSVESHIAGIWQELLGRPRIGVHDNFLEIGGDSLLAYRLISRLRDELGVDLPVRLFFQGSTVAELAQAIERVQGEPEAGAPAGEEIDTEALELLRMLDQLSDEDVALELASRQTVRD